MKTTMIILEIFMLAIHHRSPEVVLTRDQLMHGFCQLSAIQNSADLVNTIMKTCTTIQSCHLRMQILKNMQPFILDQGSQQVILEQMTSMLDSLTVYSIRETKRQVLLLNWISQIRAMMLLLDLHILKWLMQVSQFLI